MRSSPSNVNCLIFPLFFLDLCSASILLLRPILQRNPLMASAPVFDTGHVSPPSVMRAWVAVVGCTGHRSPPRSSSSTCPRAPCFRGRRRSVSKTSRRKGSKCHQNTEMLLRKMLFVASHSAFKASESVTNAPAGREIITLQLERARAQEACGDNSHRGLPLRSFGAE